MDDEIDNVARALRGHDIDLRIDGDRARLIVDGHDLERAWRHGDDAARGPQRPGELVLVLGGRLTPKAIATARKRGDWYADARGNAYVRAPGIRIDIRGQRPSEQPSVRRMANHATNLMSPRRAQVIFCLLQWPELIRASTRQVAEVAGVSTSIVHTTRLALEEEGHLYPQAGQIDRREELLDRWAEAFPLGLGRSLTLGSFVGEPHPQAWVDAERFVYVSGESAVNDLRATSLTIYVPEINPRAIAASRWRRPTQDEEPTIFVRRRFWTEPTWSGELDQDGIIKTPMLLIYADLLSSRDARQREAAMSLREMLREPRLR